MEPVSMVGIVGIGISEADGVSSTRMELIV